MSYTNLLYHIVYATKERAPLITKTLSPKLHAYLGGIVRGLGSIPIEINGVSDHVHLLVKLRPTISVSEFLSKLKSNSSGWAKRQTRGRFAWQSRYGAFTVSESQVDRVKTSSKILSPAPQARLSHPIVPHAPLSLRAGLLLFRLLRSLVERCSQVSSG